MTKLLYAFLDRMTPLAWQSVTVLALTFLSTLAIWQTATIGTELFHIFATMLITAVIGLIGLVYRRMNQEIASNREDIAKLHRQQRKMLNASLKLWTSNVPDKAAEAIDEYHKVIEESDHE